MRKMDVAFSKLICAIRSLNFTNEVALSKEVHVYNSMLFDSGKEYKDYYMEESNKGGALFVSDRIFSVDSGIAVIKKITEHCMKIVFVWFDECYNKKIEVELFWWFDNSENDSFFCVSFKK